MGFQPAFPKQQANNLVSSNVVFPVGLRWLSLKHREKRRKKRKKRGKKKTETKKRAPSKRPSRAPSRRPVPSRAHRGTGAARRRPCCFARRRPGRPSPASPRPRDALAPRAFFPRESTEVSFWTHGWRRLQSGSNEMVSFFSPHPDRNQRHLIIKQADLKGHLLCVESPPSGFPLILSAPTKKGFLT